MRELRVRIRFTKACLGDQKQVAKAGGWLVFLLPRGADKQVRFDPAWWRDGLRYAAKLINRHQDAVHQVCADGKVYTNPDARSMYRRHLPGKRYIKHECFPEGMAVDLHFAVPTEISEEDFKLLLNKLGAFRGISPYGFRDYGFFVVEQITSWENEDASSQVPQGREPAEDFPDHA